MTLELRELRALGRGGLALGPLTFAVDPGAPLAVVGAAGAGKSLLLAAIAGLVHATGTVALAERPAMIFQRDALDDAQSALDNVAIAAPRARAEAALAAVGLAAHAHKRPRALSGGMKKRVSIARALASDAAVVLADDPTAGLDPDSAREILALLLAPAERTLVIATADVDAVVPRCAHVLVLENGQARFFGPPAELAALPSSSELAVFSSQETTWL